MTATPEPAPDAPRRRLPDPLRAIRVLRRSVRLGVYGLFCAFIPVEILILGEPMRWALINNGIFLAISTVAIEGAFINGYLIRKRVAYPGALIAEMRGPASLESAAARAAEVVAPLLGLERAIVMVRGHEDGHIIRASGMDEGAATELMDSYAPTIHSSRENASITRVGEKTNQLVFVPLIGAHGNVGMLVLHATRRSDVGDAQTLQNIGARLGLHFETLWQKEQLERQQAHGEAVLAAIPDAMIRTMRDGTITYFTSRNRSAERILVPENPVGSNLYDLLPGHLRREIQTRVEKVLDGGSLEQFEFEASRESHTIHREARIVRVADDEALAIVRDIGDRRRAEEALRQREEYFRRLIENAHDPIAVVSLNGVVKYASPALARVLGYGAADELIGADGLELIHPDDREYLMQAMAEDLASEASAAKSFQFRALHKSGSWRVLEATVRPLTPGAVDSDTVVNGRDVTEERRAADILRESEERMRTIFEAAPIGMAIVSPDLRLLSVNRALCEMLGCTQADIIELGVEGMTHPDDLEKDSEERRLLVKGQISSYSVEKRFRKKSGEYIWGDLTSTVIRDAEGNLLYGLGMIENITDRKRAEDEVRRLAFHDPLTGLPNRALFRDRLQLTIAQARRSNKMAAVMFLDLDGFKDVNDSVGHVEGDRLLCETAEKLSRIVREGDTLSRVGGDEFTILLPTIDTVQDAVRIADRILAGLAEPVVLAGKEFAATGSIGVTIIPDDGSDADTLLRNADIAMYRAKEQGRNQYQLFAPHMNEAILERNEFERRLRRAIENEEFTLHYQPLFDVQTMEVRGVEALLRWPRDDGTLIGPDEFLPVAEETGLVVPLGEWVLRGVCRQAKSWQEAGLPPTRVAINVSRREFCDGDFVARVEAALEETGLDPDCLQIEIGAGGAMEQAEATLETLRRLKAIGVHLALDDFGTGYSSISYLKRFPLDVLKIDRSFVGNLGNVKADAALVGAMITVGHSLGLRVVAEGVENLQQLRFLRDPQARFEAQLIAVCDEFQGFLGSHPLAPAEIEPLLRRGAAPAAAETRSR